MNASTDRILPQKLSHLSYGSAIFLPPCRPTRMVNLPLNPVSVILFRLKRLLPRFAPFTAPRKEVFSTEIQTAAIFTAIRFTAAHVPKPSVNYLTAARMVAECWDSIPDISIPVFIETDTPSHHKSSHPVLPLPAPGTPTFARLEGVNPNSPSHAR